MAMSSSSPDFNQVPLEERPRSADESQVAVPSLNVFLGSTPSFAALEVMRSLIYLPESDRRRVALVYLDIDSPPAEVIQFRQEHPGFLREFDLRISVAHGVLYADQLDPDKAGHTYIPTKIPESFDNGAGGIRNNGHVAACTDYAKIVQLFDEALAAIGALPMDRNARPVTEVQINIVAFLGGGTGSGILPDIAVMTRHRILQLNLKHRLNIFCLLPEHIREATVNDISWRKSNAAATLMELVGLSIAKRSDGRPGPYIKYMQNNPYEVRGTTVANEVYLFGRTSMTSAEDAARIIGLDLYTRITNASGVGFLERSKSVDRRTLGNFDATGMPTMFGTTCPLEVVFPAEETAEAFAKLTASKVLPSVAGDLESERRSLSATELDEVKDWDRALAPDEPMAFTERSFATAGRDRLDVLEARLHKQIEEAEAQIKERSQAKEAEEKQKIHAAHLGPLAAQVQRLEARKRIYQAALARAQDQNVPSKGRPDRQLQRKLLHAWNIMGQKERAIAAVTDDFNRVQKRNIRADLLETKKRLLLRLIDYVDAELKHAKRFQEEVDNDQAVRDLRREALAAPAMRGLLEHQHAHRRHLFDLPGMAGMNAADGSSPPTKRLYEALTASKPAETYAQDFIRWMHETYGEDSGMRGVNAGDLRDRLVRYLQNVVYLPRLTEMNLFDLLDMCCVVPGERHDQKVEDVLYAHLQHISGLARELVAFEAQLWSEGSAQLSTSLYMGASWDNGGQRRILDRARGRLGAIAKEGASPLLASAIDPHRLQLVYGQHGISLSTIPDFYQDANSMMGEFLRHQGAWDPRPEGRPYGQSKAPVFASGEMERLAMVPGAVEDVLPPGGRGRSMPERLIRRPQYGAGGEPRWGRDRVGAGTPAGMPGGGMPGGGMLGNGLGNGPANGLSPDTWMPDGPDGNGLGNGTAARGGYAPYRGGRS
jgi:hypothetical protein